MATPLDMPYRIVTPTVVLRPFDPADTPAVRQLIIDSLEHLRPWVSWAAAEPKALAEKLREVRGWRAAFDLDHGWHWAMLGADDGELAGALVMTRLPGGDTVDTGGWVGPTRTRRGYTTDAAAAIARVAFEVLGATRVQACTDPCNHRSNALMRKLGYTHEATTRHLEHGQRKDEWVWSILATEWPSTFAAEIASEARAFDALGHRVF